MTSIRLDYPEYDDGQAAHNDALQLEKTMSYGIKELMTSKKDERSEDDIVGYRCPYCTKIHGFGASGIGVDIACCGEIGHCEPYYGDEDED